MSEGQRYWVPKAFLGEAALGIAFKRRAALPGRRYAKSFGVDISGLREYNISDKLYSVCPGNAGRVTHEHIGITKGGISRYTSMGTCKKHKRRAAGQLAAAAAHSAELSGAAPGVCLCLCPCLAAEWSLYGRQSDAV